MISGAWKLGIVSSLCTMCMSFAALGEASEDEEIPIQSDRIYGVQCGLDATIFVLEYFHIKYPLERVSAGLPLTPQGIALSDVRDMLLGFGLDAEPRKNVTSRRLTKALSADIAAIVPLPTNRTGSHYFVAVADNSGRPVLVDPPRKVHPLPDAIPDPAFLESEGTVLFVQRKTGHTRKRMSDEIVLSPGSIELGQFLVTGSAREPTERVNFSMTNSSDFPIMVSLVQGSCGCLEQDWRGGLLAPGEKQDVHFSLYTQAMAGIVKKSILVKFGDGSSLTIPIRGEGVTVEKEHGIQISQDSVRIDITKHQHEESMDVRLTRVNALGVELPSLSATSESEWLAPTIRPSDDESGELWAALDVAHVKQLLGASGRPVVAGVRLATNADIEPVRLTVEVVRRDSFHAEPAMLSVVAETSKPQVVRLCPDSSSSEIETVKVMSVPKGLQATVAMKDGIPGIEVSVQSPEAVVLGFDVLVLSVESQGGLKEVARVPLRLLSSQD